MVETSPGNFENLFYFEEKISTAFIKMTLICPALYIVYAGIIIFIIIQLPNIQKSFDSPYLLFVLNTLFIGFTGFFIGYLGAKSFIKRGNWEIFWFVTAALTFDLGSLPVGLLSIWVGRNPKTVCLI